MHLCNWLTIVSSTTISNLIDCGRNESFYSVKSFKIYNYNVYMPLSADNIYKTIDAPDWFYHLALLLVRFHLCHHLHCWHHHMILGKQKWQSRWIYQNVSLIFFYVAALIYIEALLSFIALNLTSIVYYFVTLLSFFRSEFDRQKKWWRPAMKCKR